MIALRFYRIYDIGREVNLDWLEKELAASFVTARTRFRRVKPKSIIMEIPPLMLWMEPVLVEKDGRTFDFKVVARIYDVGAISVCFVYERTDADMAVLEDTALLFAGQEGLSDFFLSYLKTLGEILKPHIKDFALNPDFFEDYTIHVTDRLDDAIDPVVLLTGERTAISSQMREEILKNTQSYTVDDRAILSWDAALLCNPEYPADLIDLIEYANVQVLELRYYDRELTRQMEKMYDDIALADHLPWFRRTRHYHGIMADLMETNAEFSEIIEKIDNLIKVTEDVYYARVYATVLKVIRSGQWSESVSRKIEVIRENYSMLSDEVRIQHSHFLEWVIIVLIALEFGFAIWEYFIR
ncbi:MAG TPA: hypothetical protein ENN52_08205 [Methanofollis liminatans]|uniref:DUF155 domain-containing protein n=1 Tax=Methanofollis liminatans TaxID=2201 RepID=A0A831LSJ3_9EURY|nr:hypothetical protein [Methanofollis liminatans]